MKLFSEKIEKEILDKYKKLGLTEKDLLNYHQMVVLL